MSFSEAIFPCVQTDLEFVGILGQVRGGACPQSVLRQLLAACRRPLDVSDGILPTKLYTHRFAAGLEMPAKCPAAYAFAQD